MTKKNEKIPHSLKPLLPTEFQQTLLIHNELGNCIGYQVQIGDRTFYGEGSTAKIAKGLAAKDALTYIKVLPLNFNAKLLHCYSLRCVLARSSLRTWHNGTEF